MMSDFLHRAASWYLGLGPVKRGILAFALTVFALEVVLRTFARGSVVYKLWTRGFEALGHVWSVVILSFIYALSVGPVSLLLRLARKDLLDVRLDAAPSYWKKHQPNPLPAKQAARHQF